VWALDIRRRTWAIAGVALAVAVTVRIHNAFAYKMLWGFDALYNWRYIKYLTHTWTLPAPDAGWATAHPPFFYYLCAAICRGFDHPDLAFNVIVLRLLSSAAGLLTVALAIVLVRRTDPENRRRALLAGGLVLFLPVHIYMSAMLTEEVLVTSLISLVVVGVCLELAGAIQPRATLRYAALLGLIAGLAFLTKLTGVLVVAAAAGAYLVDGFRQRKLRPALRRAGVLVAIAAVVGGWYYARNLIEYGYLYPHGLEVHKIMYTMPPGDRQIWDYLRVPLATWADPQLVHPDLLRSIWGSTYVTMWFDGHRSFLPRDTAAVTFAGTAILLLALLPTAAYALGLARGVRRSWQGERGPDTMLVLIVGITVAGYILFTWRNPWFAVLKASFLLSLSLPFAYYTSEVLDDWMRKSGGIRSAVWGVLAVLALLISATFTFSELFWNMDHMSKPGVLW
jgi:4-amino-4-deoxy-L-arabinose transferase-like glycosyltransferase